jgi:hypothetical protein
MAEKPKMKLVGNAFWSLGFGTSLVSGAWRLVLGTSPGVLRVKSRSRLLACLADSSIKIFLELFGLNWRYLGIFGLNFFRPVASVFFVCSVLNPA